MGIREDLFSKLVAKTKELGRQVKFSDMLEDKKKDNRKPHPNDYAFYYGSFDEAAKQAFAWGTPWPKVEMGVDIMSRKRPCPFSKEKQEGILAELVEMFINNDGLMPSARQIKNNRYVSENEIDTMRYAGLIDEKDIRRRAEEKTGRKFLSPAERRNQQKVAVVPEVALEEVGKVNEEKRKVEEVVVTEELKKTRPKSKPRRAYRVKTDEELWAEIRKKCAEAGHILTDAEINADETLSAPQTYYNHLGKGYKSAIYLETAPLPADTKVTEEEPAPAPEVVAGPEAEPMPEVVVEPEEEPAPEVKPAPKAEPALEVKLESDLAEIPFKLIIPKGIKGTITLNLEF